jgi:hypothetical protein
MQAKIELEPIGMPMGAPEGSGCAPDEPQVIYLIQGHDITELPCWCASDAA